MRILAIEPYYGGSHRAFLDGLAAHSAHDFRLLTLPPWKWKWRMRGAAIWAAEQLAAEPAGGIDAIFTCDMLSVADLRALLPRPLRAVPVVCYFHENQLTYPIPDERERDYQYAFTNLTSALAADAVWFNSEYHRGEFLGAMEKLLKKMPDCLPAHAIDQVRRKSRVMWPGIDPPAVRHAARGEHPIVLWNQRWEFDKNPEAFFAALFELAGRGVAFRLICCGEQFRTAPAIFEEARRRLADRIEHWGYAAERAAYAALLARADVVVSTAAHEFFGLSVVEAVAAGARPLLPRRLSYPELFDPARWPDVFYGADGELPGRLADVLAEPAAPEGLAARAGEFLWPARTGEFDAGLAKATE